MYDFEHGSDDGDDCVDGSEHGYGEDGLFYHPLICSPSICERNSWLSLRGCCQHLAHMKEPSMRCPINVCLQFITMDRLPCISWSIGVYAP